MEKGRIDSLIQQVKEKKTTDKKAMKIVKDFLIIDTGNRLIAIQIEYLREVIELLDRKEVIPVPFIPDYFKGIIDIRGEIIPVLSLPTIIGEKYDKEEEYIKGIIIEHKIKICFLFVQTINLLTIDINRIKSVKDVRKTKTNAYYSEEFEYEGDNVVILDIPKLFESEYLS